MDGLGADAGSRGPGDEPGNERDDRRGDRGLDSHFCVQYVGAPGGDAVDDEEGVWRGGRFEAVRLWGAGPEGGGCVDHAVNPGYTYQLDCVCCGGEGETLLS